MTTKYSVFFTPEDKKQKHRLVEKNFNLAGANEFKDCLDIGAPTAGKYAGTYVVKKQKD